MLYFQINPWALRSNRLLSICLDCTSWPINPFSVQGRLWRWCWRWLLQRRGRFRLASYLFFLHSWCWLLILCKWHWKLPLRLHWPNRIHCPELHWWWRLVGTAEKNSGSGDLSLVWWTQNREELIHRDEINLRGRSR